MNATLRNWFFFLSAIPLTALIYYAPAHDQTLAPRFLGLSLLMLLLYGAELYRSRRSGDKTAWGWADLLFLCWYGWNLASAGWSMNLAEAWFSAQKIGLAYAVFWFARRAMVELWSPAGGPAELSGTEKAPASFSSDPWTPLLTVHFIGMLLVTGYFWFDLLRQGKGDLLEFLQDPCNMGSNLYKLVGFSGHRNLNAGLLFMLLPLGVSAAVRWKGPLRWSVMAVLALQVSAIVLLDSAAVLLSLVLAAGLGLLGWLALEGFRNGSARHRRAFWAASAAAAVLGMGLLVSPIGGNLAQSLRESDTGSERLLLWYRTDQLIQEHPVQGVGAGNWQFLLPSKTLTGSYRLQEQHIFATRPHNDFLWVLAETGYVGLALWLALLGYTLILGARAAWHSRDAFEQRVLAWTLSGLLGYCVFASFDFPKERIEHQALLGIWMALLTSAGLAKGRKLRLSPWAMLPLMLPLAWNCWIGFDRTRAESGIREINRAKQDLSSLPQLSPQQFQTLADHYGFELNTQAPVREQRAQVSKGLWSSYRNIAENLRSPWFTHDATTFPVSWHLAVPNYYLGDTARSFQYFEQAYYEHPYHVDIANNYGSLLLGNRRFDEAIALYQKALAINPDFLDGMLNLSKAFFNKQSFEESKAEYDRLNEKFKEKKERLDKKVAEETAFELRLPSRCRGKYENLKILQAQKKQLEELGAQMEAFYNTLLGPRLASLAATPPPPPTPPVEGKEAGTQ
jgi:O-antigen ligase